MTTKNSVGELIMEYYNRKKENDITLNSENNEVTFSDFLKMDYRLETITFTEQELEVAILYSLEIKIEEIIKAFHITQSDFENIFISLKNKISAPKSCSKKYIANRMALIFPNEICYKILEKYNLTKISVKRKGFTPENKYVQNEYEKLKEDLASKQSRNINTPEQNKLLVNVLSEILKVISSKMTREELIQIINNGIM